jgi:TusE/DsrC/DsvC family sulfur relay protein
MPTLVIGTRTYEVDQDGFLQNSELWDKTVALDLALNDGIQELTEDHWKVINYIRNYYENYAIAPMIRKLCKATGFTLEQIYVLFPLGPAKGACKVAGLAQPAGCV